MEVINVRLEKANSIQDVEARIAYLREGVSNAFVGLMKINFNTDLDMMLPEGAPPYKPNVTPLNINHSYLENEFNAKFRMFLDPGMSVSKIRREQEFADILERLHPDEANVLIHIKEHNLTALYPNITKTVVMRAYWDETYQEEEKIAVPEGQAITKTVADDVGTIDEVPGMTDEELTETIKDYSTLLASIPVTASQASKLMGVKYPTFVDRWKKGTYVEFGPYNAGSGESLNALQVMNVLFRIKNKTRTNRVIKLFFGE